MQVEMEACKPMLGARATLGYNVYYLHTSERTLSQESKTSSGLGLRINLRFRTALHLCRQTVISSAQIGKCRNKAMKLEFIRILGSWSFPDMTLLVLRQYFRALPRHACFVRKQSRHMQPFYFRY